MPTIQEIVNHCQRVLIETKSEELAPVFYFIKEDGKFEICVCDFFQSDAHKDAVMAMVREKTEVEQDIERVVSVSEVWMARQDHLEEGQTPSESIARKEYLMVLENTRVGDPQMWMIPMDEFRTGEEVDVSKIEPQKGIGGRMVEMF